MDAEANVSELGSDLRSAVGRIYRRFRTERVAGDLGDKALEVLVYIHKYGPLTLTELSDADGVAPASMSQTVNRHTAAGYAVRTPGADDRRKVRFTTTAEGETLAAASVSQRNAWLEAHLAALSNEDRAALARASALLSEIADS